jgi:5-methylcytosine-specific restriction endonuclease McrA
VSPVDELILRDGPACVWCGHEPWRADLTAEHLLPRARRGRTTAENLALACRRCNRRRGTQPVSAYVRAQRAAGRRPRVDLLVAALERLGRSETPGHAAYGTRQLTLLQRLG